MSEEQDKAQEQTPVADGDAIAATEAETTEAAPTTEATAELAAVIAERDTLKAQLEEQTSQYMRLAADFENFRKRTLKEKEDLEVQIKCSTITDILPVVDNFDRARNQLQPQHEEALSIHKSYQGLYKQLIDCLKRIGVQPMRAQGEPFDPNLHEAVMREPSAEFEEDVVSEELQRGYILGERVIRHALVKVSMGNPEAPSEG